MEKRHLNLFVPRVLKEALSEGARKNLTTKSEYLRRALMATLEKDGIKVEQRAA